MALLEANAESDWGLGLPFLEDSSNSGGCGSLHLCGTMSCAESAICPGFSSGMLTGSSAFSETVSGIAGFSPGGLAPLFSSGSAPLPVR